MIIIALFWHFTGVISLGLAVVCMMSIVNRPSDAGLENIVDDEGGKSKKDGAGMGTSNLAIYFVNYLPRNEYFIETLKKTSI